MARKAPLDQFPEEKWRILREGMKGGKILQARSVKTVINGPGNP